MKLSPADLPKLYPAVLLALSMLAAGAGSVYLARESTRDAQRQYQAALAERNEIDGRLKRVRSEEQEIKRKSALFADLRTRGVIGEEQRLEWSELLGSIRTQRRLPQLDYEIAPQVQLDAAIGNFSIHASRMKLNLRLLHEEDLVNFLDDLRNNARALILVRSCAVTRLARGAADAAPLAHLQADCQIDWLTLRGPGAETGKGGHQ